MSRKWSRMVRKNTKVTNVQRKKSGQGLISEQASSDHSETFRGRSWVLPMLLVATGVFCFIAFRGQAGSDDLYWVTGASYIFLALLMFWLRRPFLKIGKDAITSRRFGGDRSLKPEDIQEISVNKDAIVITMKGKSARWAFSRIYHQFPVEAARPKLVAFAQEHQVQLQQEA
ncbi:MULTISPECIES: hypothetical protein [Paenibacillus]|uniref:hypothetical protein n=1 Tax=Paenibacillus TaxID=44249 RepID=UPI0022B8FF63|nr:hypothetical protein [Paenibacillus caseinilyticus]MCZ8521487.1 hypothetical protein [Paenibacillus caseinilyticus]